MRRGFWAAVTAVAVSALVMAPGVGAADPAPGIPPDGPAGPTVSLATMLSTTSIGSPVTTQPLKVTKVTCSGDCESPTSPADFWLSDGKQTIRVHVQNTWQATFNVKKQNFVPQVGQTVVAQGRLQLSGGQRIIEDKRFAERDHAGPTLHAYELASGKAGHDRYVWLAPVKVLNVAKWADGDTTFDVRDPAGGGMVHVELSPPFAGQLHIPKMGDMVTPYGMAHYDSEHGWWEMHPVRCWSHTECVPLVASYVRNAPPAGSAKPGSGPDGNGYYVQGGPVPAWVPMNGGTSNSTFTATFAPHNGNDWWLQVQVTSSKTVVAVSASINGGPSIALSHSSWGDWTKSTYVPTGSHVVFTAVASDGATAKSPTYTWPSGAQA